MSGDSGTPNGAPQVKKEISEGTGRTCILVLGMHRSGTSALTRVLNLLGAALPRHVVGPGPGNEAGHWEPARLVHYHERLFSELATTWHDWRPLDLTLLSPERREQIKADIRQILDEDYGDEPLFIVKDPRICRFTAFFIEVLEEAGLQVVPIITIRNPLDVSNSLQMRTAFWPRRYTNADAALLWLSHVLTPEKDTRGLKRAIVTYSDLMSDWRDAVLEIVRHTDLEFPVALDEAAPLIGDFLTGDLRHHAHKYEEVAIDPLLKGWISDAYDALLAIAAKPGAARRMKELDRIGDEFQRALPIIDGLWSAASEAQASTEVDLAEARSSLKIAEADLSERQAELDATRTELARLQKAEKDAAAEEERVRKADASWVEEIERARRALGAKAGNGRDLEQLMEALKEEDIRRDIEIGEAREVTAASVSETATQKEQRKLLQSLHDRMDELTELVAEQNSTRADLDATATKSGRQVAEAHHETGNPGNGEIDALKAEIADRQRDAELLRAEMDTLRAAYRNSTSWRLTAPIRGMKTIAVGLARLPGRVVPIVGKIPAAVRFGGGVGPSIVKAARVYRREGISGIKWRMDHASRQLGSGSPVAKSPAFQPLPAPQMVQASSGGDSVEIRSYVDQVLSTAKKKPGIDLEYVPKSPHAFDVSDCPVKAIAFYLPQFHPIPENDEWWGKGFTEWTNVSKAATSVHRALSTASAGRTRLL